MLRKKILTTACVALTTFSFYGAAEAKVMLAPTWSGFYIGGGLGVQQLNADIDASSTATKTDRYYNWCTHNCHKIKTTNYDFSGSDDASGDWDFFGTAMIGYDHQVSERVVVGAFANIDFGSADLDYNIELGSGRSGADITGSLETDRSFTLGGRVGYVFDEAKMTMGYILAGYTRTSVDGSLNVDFAGVPASDFSQAISGDLNGVTLGAGLERRINERWSARLEYRYTWLGDIDSLYSEATSRRVGPNCFTTSSSETDVNFDPNIHSVRAVLSYKFGDQLTPLPEPLK